MKNESKVDYKKIERIEDIQINPKNHNKGTERGIYAIEQSIRKLGVGRSGLIDANGHVIAGNHTAQAIADLGIPIKVVPTDGSEWILVQRVDLDLETDNKAVELSYADNRSSELNFDLDITQLAVDVANDIDVSFLYSDAELQQLLDSVELPPENTDIDEDELSKTEHKCPNCGFSF